MNNRLWNIKNPHQTAMLKVLCVCSAGLLRSPTAANVLHAEYGYNTRSCGAEADFALIPMDDVLLEWAEEIVCMEQHHANIIPAEFQSKVVVLNIPDKFSWGQEELKEAILESYKHAE